MKPDVTGNAYSLFNKSLPLLDGSGISADLSKHFEFTPAEQKVIDQAVRTYHFQIGEQIVTTAVREVSESDTVTQWSVPPFFELAKREFGVLESMVRGKLDETRADALIAGLWGHLLDKGFFEQVLTIDTQSEARAAFFYERRDPKTGRRIQSWYDSVGRGSARLDIDVNRLP